MPWNREKWNQFVSDSTKPPPTDAAAQEAADEAKVLAEAHEEDIDTTALGVERIKKMLIELAAETPGTQGSQGPPGVADPDAIERIGLANVRYTDGTIGSQTIITHTFAPGELVGAGTLLQVEFFGYNLWDVQPTWTIIPAIPTPTETLFSFAAHGGSADGHHVIWVSQGHHPFDIGSDYRALSRSVGPSTYPYQNTNAGANWMDAGGYLTLVITPIDLADPTLNWGGLFTVSKLIFPSVTQE